MVERVLAEITRKCSRHERRFFTGAPERAAVNVKPHKFEAAVLAAALERVIKKSN
jgi:hypothetical protein